MGGQCDALLSPVRELRQGHEEQCAGNEMQLVRCDETFARFQSCKAKGERLFNTSLQRLRFSGMFLVWHHSGAAEAEAIHVFCVSIPTLFLRSPQTSVDPESRDRQADLAMRSVQKVNIHETFPCTTQRRSRFRDYETTEIVFMYSHVGVSSGDASRQKCRDLSDSPGHATCEFVYVYTCWCAFRRCVESQMPRPE